MSSNKPSGKIGPDGKRRKSGSSYRKDREDKKKKIDEIVNKTPKLGTYFSSEPKKMSSGKCCSP